jgi:hypothetical protein
MTLIRQRRGRTGRQWLGLCLALLLVCAPPLNLAGVDLAVEAQAESGANRAHDGQGHSGHHDPGERRSGLAHHTSSNACLQCLALGGMALAGAATLRELAPALHGIGATWTLASLIWDSRDAKLIVCRGPPALV